VIFDYETLKLLGWGFVGVLLLGFAVMDGFDMGVATLLPYVARTDRERRVVINSVGPTWEGNQTPGSSPRAAPCSRRGPWSTPWPSRASTLRSC
jgi:hypothetical protein